MQQANSASGNLGIKKSELVFLGILPQNLRHNDKTMNDSQFHSLIDECLTQIEEALDEAIDEMETDLDYETMAGILTLTFENKTKIIINRQEPLHQLWLATRENGFHFDYVEGQWRDDKSGKLFWDILEDACEKQSGEKIVLRG